MYKGQERFEFEIGGEGDSEKCNSHVQFTVIVLFFLAPQ